MGQKIGAGAVLAIIGITLVILGIGYLGAAIAAALTPSVGTAGAYAVTGGIFVGPALFWAILTLLLTRAPAAQARGNWAVPSAAYGLAVFAAIAKETPWIAIAGAGRWWPPPRCSSAERKK